MEILHFEGSSRAPLKHRKGFRVILGITVMGLFGALGSTLAANITINQGPVEFGQGLAAAATIADSYSAVTVSITDTFSVSSMSGAKPSITTSANGFTLTFDTPLTTAGKVYKVTVESSKP